MMLSDLSNNNKRLSVLKTNTFRGLTGKSSYIEAMNELQWLKHSRSILDFVSISHQNYGQIGSRLKYPEVKLRYRNVLLF